MNKLDSILYDFLVEESGMPVGEFRLLSEEVKTETVLEIANTILNNIQMKLGSIDTYGIDRSRGEIKNFADLQIVQDVITKLTSLGTQYIDVVNPKLPIMLKEIVKAINNVNKYSSAYKEAYRTKKTLSIISYQAILLSIISVLSYLVSVVIDFKDPQHVKIKANAQIEDILPYKTILDFNTMVDNGTYNSLMKDVSVLREFYTEYSLEELSTIYEAVDVVNLIRNGISAFSSDIGSRKIVGPIFKVLGIIMIILSVRDIFYTLSNSRTKITEKIQNLKTFLNIDKIPSTSALTRYITFNNKNAVDAVYTSKAASQEIADENKEIIFNAKNKPSEFDDSGVDFVPTKENTPVQSTSNDLFADFNF